ncbi:glutaredoxin family protein [Peribacillus sp. SCS-155]|uniref:glutaredoxin family protein n=1 Tax=Peribacillus sedimenti TaxID=3115297 RepID=UPI0039063B2B
MNRSSFILYSRGNCPLCDKAKLILEEIREESGLTYEEIDIYSDDELIEKYALMIPVLELNGQLIQYGNIDKSMVYAHFQK